MDFKNLDRTKIIAIIIVILVIALAAVFGLTMDTKRARKAEVHAPVEIKEATDNSCADNVTFQGLKRLLFDQASQIRTLERANFDILAQGVVVRMENPVTSGRDETLDLTRCSGRFVLELPPGAEAAFNGERRLTADISYEVQTTADGRTYRMRGAEGLVSRLAAFDMEGRRLESPTETAPDDLLTDPNGLPPFAPESIDPVTVPDVNVHRGGSAPTISNPSFDCRLARTRGELFVCGSDRLAAQDRQMAELYRSAMEDGGRVARRELARTRDNFLAYRDSCRDSACVAQAYDGRMREIRDIMAEGD